jgi:hypothetical protein
MVGARAYRFPREASVKARAGHRSVAVPFKRRPG